MRTDLGNSRRQHRARGLCVVPWLASVLLLSCGLNRTPRYPDKEGEEVAPPPQTGDQVAEPGPAPISEQAETQPNGPTVQDVPAPPIPDYVDATLLVTNLNFRSMTDMASLQGLDNGGNSNNNRNALAEALQKQLGDTAPNDELTLEQEFSGPAARSHGRFGFKSSALDKITGTSQSGSELFTRVSTQTLCPFGLVCVTQFVFMPVKGDATTYCFFDAEGKKAAPIPYGVDGEAPRDAVRGNVDGTYGPFVGRSYPGAAVNCSQPDGKPLAEEHFRIFVAEGGVNGGNGQLLFQTKALPLSHQITIEARRVAGDSEAPFLDETMRLRRISEFRVSEELRVVAMVIRGSRQSLDPALKKTLGIDGFQISTRSELCENKLLKTGGVFCK